MYQLQQLRSRFTEDLQLVYKIFTPLCLLVILLPPVVMGPYLPLTDTIAYVGLNNYPPALSYGPEHYYLFQFTYILLHILLRILHDIGFGVGQQILIIYLVQMFLVFFSLRTMLSLFLMDSKLFYIALAGGLLCFWSGLFLWGGPTAYSLGISIVCLGTTLIFHEEADGADRGLLIFFLFFLSSISHPFVIPFVFLSLGARFLFLTDKRSSSLLSMAVFFAYALLIAVDNPEKLGLSRIASLFTLYPLDFMRHLVGIFSFDNTITQLLLNMSTPFSLTVLYFIKTMVIVFGFFTSPVILCLRSSTKRLRMLAFLNTVILIVYFLSNDSREAQEVIPHWPSRILMASAIVTWISGFSNFLFLGRKVAPRFFLELSRRRVSVIVLLFLFLAFLCQFDYFHDNKVEETYRHLKRQLLQNVAPNTHVNISYSYQVIPYRLHTVNYKSVKPPPPAV